MIISESFHNFCLDCEINENFDFEITDVLNESVERTPSGKVKYRGELFPGLNKPKRYKGAGVFKYRVLAHEKGEYKILNFGHKDYKDFLQHKDSERRKNFRNRMGCDKKHSKLTKKYWVCNYNW